jgi:NmrA-like family
VFGVTDFGGPLQDPKIESKLAPGQTIMEYAGEICIQHGKNIVDAVAKAAESTLEHFIWSSLSAATDLSKGKYKGMHHFDSKAKIVEYASNYPTLVAKMSVLQLGLYFTNWKINPGLAPRKVRMDNMWSTHGSC